MRPAAVRAVGAVGAMSNEQLERGLQASVKIYTFAQTKLAAMGRGTDAECTLSRAEVVDIKKASAAMNRALTALVRKSHDAENRLTLELHMLRGIMQREHTDREANRARVFELFRRYNGTTGGGSAGADDGASFPATGAGSSSSGGGGGGGGGCGRRQRRRPRPPWHLCTRLFRFRVARARTLQVKASLSQPLPVHSCESEAVAKGKLLPVFCVV